MTEDAINIISSSLHSLQILQHLCLTGNEIEKEGIAKICDALRLNSTLTSLDLSLNSINDEGGKFISNLIRENTSVSRLSVGVCGIGEIGSEILCKELTRNFSLVALDLMGCGLNEKCMNMLWTNKYLVKLWLNCEFREQGEKIEKRNRGIWKERMKWSCRLNGIERILKGWKRMPSEMRELVLDFLPPSGVLRVEESRRSIRCSKDGDLLTLGRIPFLERVFGTGIHLVMRKIEQS